MTEYMKELVDKQCDIETRDSYYSGVVLEIDDSWIVINDTDENAVKCLNLNYVMSIEEMPQEEHRDKPRKRLFSRKGDDE